MTRGRKLNRKGRSTGKQPFVMLPHWAFKSPAYRSLRPGPRALLWELIFRYNGANNGRIGFSQRDMAVALNVSDRETVAGYVRELEAKGFIKAMRRGGFNVKVSDRRATEWALTWQKIGDELPTKEFMHWRPAEIGGRGKPASEDGKADPNPANIVRDCSNVRDFPSVFLGRAASARAG
jgi:hypothetical protein